MNKETEVIETPIATSSGQEATASTKEATSSTKEKVSTSSSTSN